MENGNFINLTGRHEHFLNLVGQHYIFLKIDMRHQDPSSRAPGMTLSHKTECEANRINPPDLRPHTVTRGYISTVETDREQSVYVL